MNDSSRVEFMQLVDCEPHEVRSIPPGRRWANKPKNEPLFKGGPVMTFGIHKGKCMSEVPRDYLRWCLEQRATSRLFVELQIEIKQFLR